VLFKLRVERAAEGRGRRACCERRRASREAHERAMNAGEERGGHVRVECGGSRTDGRATGGLARGNHVKKPPRRHTMSSFVKTGQQPRTSRISDTEGVS
jgi:hypothetical protein